jgi:hypothetical protein
MVLDLQQGGIANLLLYNSCTQLQIGSAIFGCFTLKIGWLLYIKDECVSSKPVARAVGTGSGGSEWVAFVGTFSKGGMPW